MVRQRRSVTAMDGSTKIAIGIVAAAFVLVVGFVGYREYEHHRDEDEARQMLSDLSDRSRRVGEQFQADAVQTRVDLQRQAESQAYDAARDQVRYALASNQRCVGGVVVQIDGSRYTQLGTIQYPIHCDGFYADRPLR